MGSGPVPPLTTRTFITIGRRIGSGQNWKIIPFIDSTHINASFHSEISAFAPWSAPTILHYPIINSRRRTFGRLCTPAYKLNRVIKRSRTIRIIIDARSVSARGQVVRVDQSHNWSLFFDWAHYFTVTIRRTKTAIIGDFISFCKRTVIASPDLYEKDLF